MPGATFSYRHDEKIFSWRNFFLLADRALKFWETPWDPRHPEESGPECERWMLERTHYSGGLGAIYPPMMYSIMALDVLGYGPDHPHRVEAREAVQRFDGRMTASGSSSSPASRWCGTRRLPRSRWANPARYRRHALRNAADWLLTKEVRRKGDWSVQRPNLEPSGWYFEYANEFYPDIDDTAMVLLGLHHDARFRCCGAGIGRAARDELAARYAVEGRRLGGVRCG